MKAINFRTVLLELILYQLYIATGEQLRLELVLKHDESLQSKCYLARMKAKGHTNDDHKINVTKKAVELWSATNVAWCLPPPKKKRGGEAGLELMLPKVGVFADVHRDRPQSLTFYWRPPHYDCIHHDHT